MGVRKVKHAVITVLSLCFTAFCHCVGIALPLIYASRHKFSLQAGSKNYSMGFHSEGTAYIILRYYLDMYFLTFSSMMESMSLLRVEFLLSNWLWRAWVICFSMSLPVRSTSMLTRAPTFLRGMTTTS